MTEPSWRPTAKVSNQSLVRRFPFELRQRLRTTYIGTRAKGYAFSSDSKCKQLWWIDPRSWVHRTSEAGNKQESASDHTSRWCTQHLPAFLRDAVETTLWSRFAVRGHQTSIRVHAGHHGNAAIQECSSSAPAIDVQQCRDCHDNIDDISNR